MQKQNLKIIFSLIALLIFPEFVFAVPNIGGVSGTISDGQNISVSGSGFGSHSLDIEWLGGNSGTIESGTVGQIPSKNNWSFGTGWADTYLANDYVHSGTKSLKVSTNDSDYNGDIRYDYGNNIAENQDIFASWWVRRAHTGSGQWKMFRLDFENDITDGPYQLVMFNWDTQQQFIIRPGPDVEENSWQDWSPPYPAEDSRWYRLDLRIHTSDFGQNNGTYAMSMHDPTGGGAVINETWTGRMSFVDSAGFYRWFLWQNYTGNGIALQNTWFDDLYVQVGSQARVEIGNASTWANCTFREMQFPTSWSSTVISIDINKGSFVNGSTAYLYVVDGNGEVNTNGFPIVINSSDSTSPSAPIGLGVI